MCGIQRNSLRSWKKTEQGFHGFIEHELKLYICDLTNYAIRSDQV
jgi:hypothetical protein